MSSHKMVRALSLAVILAGSAVAVTTSARQAAAQDETKCYYVVCTGNICVYEEIPCPKPTELKPVKP